MKKAEAKDVKPKNGMARLLELTATKKPLIITSAILSAAWISAIGKPGLERLIDDE